MCGIAGFYGFRNDDLIHKTSLELKHRGPDGEGFYLTDDVTLLNRRLAIIDRKGGDQPIYNEDKTIVVTYNGEIYNYQELRNVLEKRGHKFKTLSDTEVIVHGYEEWGDLCFDKFNGMFAVALNDQKHKKLILARDHFGIKPIYFSILGPVSDSLLRVLTASDRLEKSLRARRSPSSSTPKIIFSSEIKPIIDCGLIEKAPNDRIIYRYLKYRIHDDQRETFFKGIYRVMPGEMLEVRSSKLEVRKYTNLKEELLKQNVITKLRNYKITKFKEKLIDAIRLRLISEVPVGTCLSGGLDSSTIVSVVNKLLKEKVKEAESVGKIQNTFSAVFPGGTNNEEIYVDKLVKSYGLRVRAHKIYPKPEEFFKDLEDFIITQEEPTISTGPYAQYKVMQEARKYVTVLLDGQGADEMMAGYLPYYLVYLRQLWKEKKWLIFLKEILRSLDVIMNVSINQLIRTFMRNNKVKVDKLLKEKFIDSYQNEKFMVENFNLKKRLIDDIFSNSLQSLLRYEDKNAMRFSIEGRVPFLDFNLLRYLFSLSDEAIIKNGWNKNILRQSTTDLLPDLIRKRRNKIGFTTPEKEWFLRMKNKIYTIFLSESFGKRKYFNQTEVLKAFQEFIEGKNEDTMLFWRMLNIEMWMRVFIDKQNKKQVTSNKKQLGLNEGKKLEINVDDKEYFRYPIRTELFKKGDDLTKKIAELLNGYIANHPLNPLLKKEGNIGEVGTWFVVVSEKIVAIAQGRSYFIWDIKTGFWAKLLSKFVKKTPFGIGLGSPWTMQLAIQEKGLLRIVLAAVAGKTLQLLGIKGAFYKIAGREVAAIDGPTEYSLFPSNVSAKLGPKEPQKVSEEIHEKIVRSWKLEVGGKKTSNLKLQTSNFLGVVIIDANDLGQNVLGNTTGLDNKLIEKIFSDNPMGQSNEQTPLVMVQF